MICCQILFLGLLVLLTHGTPVEKRATDEDDCNWEEFDKWALTAQIMGHREAFIPQNMQEMEERCRIDEQAIKLWRKNQIACLEEPLTRQVVSLILQSIQRMVKLRCTDPEYQKIYFRSSKCFPIVISSLHGCMDKFTEELHLITRADLEYQVPLACCHYNSFEKCTREHTRGKCNPVDEEFIAEFVDGYAGDTLGLMCSGYEPDSPLCTELELPKNSANVTESYKAFLWPIVKILDSVSRSSIEE